MRASYTSGGGKCVVGGEGAIELGDVGLVVGVELGAGLACGVGGVCHGGKY